MAAKRWYYRELAKLPRNVAIPAEANADIVDGLQGFHCQELLAMLDTARELRAFGCLSIKDAAGRTWAEVELHNGVAVKVYRYTHAVEKQGRLKPCGPYILQMCQSSMNKKVSMKKPEVDNE